MSGIDPVTLEKTELMKELSSLYIVRTATPFALYTLADWRRLNVTPGLTCIWPVSEIAFPQQVDRTVRKRSIFRPGLILLWWVRKKANIDYLSELTVDLEAEGTAPASTDVLREHRLRQSGPIRSRLRPTATQNAMRCLPMGSAFAWREK